MTKYLTKTSLASTLLRHSTWRLSLIAIAIGAVCYAFLFDLLRHQSAIELKQQVTDLKRHQENMFAEMKAQHRAAQVFFLHQLHNSDNETLTQAGQFSNHGDNHTTPHIQLGPGVLAAKTAVIDAASSSLHMVHEAWPQKIAMASILLNDQTVIEYCPNCTHDLWQQTPGLDLLIKGVSHGQWYEESSDQEHINLVRFSAPLRDREQSYGILNVSWFIRPLDEFSSSINTSILTEHGSVISQSSNYTLPLTTLIEAQSELTQFTRDSGLHALARTDELGWILHGFIATQTIHDQLRPLLFATIVVGLVALFLELYCQRRLYRKRLIGPLQEFTDAIFAIAQNNERPLIEKNRSDEFGTLGRYLTVMQQSIERQKNALSEQIQLREHAEHEAKQQNSHLTAALNEHVAIQERIQSILDHIPALIYMVSPSKNLILANQRFYKVLHTKPESVLGSPLQQSLDEHVGEALDAAHEAVLDSHKSFQTDIYLTINNKNHQFVLHRFPIYSGNGDLYAVGATAMDISQRVQLEQQLHKAQKLEALGQLAGGIAHDFNNLLAGIVGYSEILTRDQLNKQLRRQHAASILSIADKAGDLTKQLLSFSRQSEMNLAPLHMHEQIDETLRMVTRTFHRNIIIDRQLAAKEDRILGDSSMLSNAILNLALNARDAMPQGGRISFKTENIYLSGEQQERLNISSTNESFMVLHISDTGIGMDEATQQHLFDPFFTTKEKGKGTGLGLAMVYGAIQQHGGAIDLSSQPGVGSCFTIYLPTHTAAQVANQHQHPNEPIQPHHVLLIDDDEDILECTSNLLRQQHCTVHVATHGERALEILHHKNDSIQAVLVDLIMPGLHGVALIKRIQLDFPTVPIIAWSGYYDDELAQAATTAGASAFLRKPFHSQDLFNVIESVCQQNHCDSSMGCR